MEARALHVLLEKHSSLEAIYVETVLMDLMQILPLCVNSVQASVILVLDLLKIARAVSPLNIFKELQIPADCVIFKEATISPQITVVLPAIQIV